MDAFELMSQARDAMTVKRVFGEPIEHDGTMLVPVARVGGGAGGGGGQDPSGEGGGEGGGFGLSARPAGMYVLRDGDVQWRPAVDVGRIVLGGQIVAVVALLTIRSIMRARSRP